MKPCRFCTPVPVLSVTSRSRGVEFVKWAMPSVLLAVMPKCPACVAAYVAIGTGLGLSLPAAAAVRGMLVILCITSLSYLIASRIYRWAAAVRATN
jgi:hypothetical protein